MKDPVADLLRALEGGPVQPVYLIHGDLVLAEPAAKRLAEAIAATAGCHLDERRRPERLAPVLDDLRTFSLFEPAKVVLVVDSAVLADREAAAGLIDQAEQGLPAPAGGELPAKARQAASRLLQALRLFDLDVVAGDPADLLERLPDWVFAGAKKSGGRQRARGKKQVRDLREGLAALLVAAREAGLVGWAEGETALLGEVIHDGLPANHCLVLAERSVANDHPLVQALRERKAVAALGASGVLNI
ncbi:MAG: hypothetical protein KDD11_17805, partial [Acidobacteria bacterium]|nr:hypothetical protein [Acidobacteriota bacterium]